MKIPVNPQCQHCKERYEGFFIIGASNFQWDCTKCGRPNVGILDLDMTTGVQIWVKASHELTKTRDFSMAVILSAMAIDCELSHLFKKWTGIGRLLQPAGGLLTEEECEELLLEFRRVSEKFRDVTKLLVPEGFQDFVCKTEKWRDVVTEELPELDTSCLIKSIEKEVFWPRNRILHSGTPATMEQAELAVRIARGCLRIFLAMDYETKILPS